MRPTELLALELALALPFVQAQERSDGSVDSDEIRAQAAVGTADNAEDVVTAGELAPTAAAETANEPVDLPETAATEELEADTAVDATETPAETEKATQAPVVPAETAAVPVTTTPALRSNDTPTIANAAVGADAGGSYLNQGNPLLLGGLAALCCVFLLLWGRKRRLASLNGGADTSAAVESGAKAAGAGAATKKVGSKVQYSRIDDQFEAESPFSRNPDDSDDYDDEMEDGFGQDRDKWDDWEPEDSAADPNPFASPVGIKFSPAPEPSAPSLPGHPASAPTFKINPPPAATELHEVVVSVSAASPPADSVGSNSSSDSFEVVTEESTATSSYPLFAAPAPAKVPKKAKPEEKKQSVDDLFSQFGMVPTFKNGVQQQPVAVAVASSSSPSSSRAPGAVTGTGVETATPAMPSSSALPSAAEASALFAAELDDLGIAAAADDWGEDDEWVKGI